ncbi:DNA methyltransferase 3-like protein [Dinothrombium tinctorium]|uniref:DNA methyltransferase 3-like protein n=1 Tax=Dinothrombium tinctorium TaxID=1965070 RepID=A0A3S3P3U4_9ACAR|nr:DNA methyltransferase 3-like protein [Dinothrombium tinctorium]RWS04535.1 DNA methyltransferase 3-like protein [Dinothrombium tinctorium]RWS04653.1 DNA methyltransferase 3-like protein [Dinothrombium tinctorium]
MSGQTESPMDLTQELKMGNKKKYKLLNSTSNNKSNNVEQIGVNLQNDNALSMSKMPIAAETAVDTKPEKADNVDKEERNKRKSDARASNPLMRGKHGLRPLPPQVDYYQSVLEEKKARISRDSCRAYKEEVQDSSAFESSPSPAKRSRRSNDLKNQRSEVNDHKREAKSKKPESDEIRSSLIQCKIQNIKAGVKNRFYFVINYVEYTGSTQRVRHQQPVSLLTPSDSMLPTQQFVVGDVVWATLPSYKTWFPGLIISHIHCGQRPARTGQTWVYWFGDHQVSEIPKSKVKSFIPNFHDFSKGTSSLTSPRMKEALQVLASRAGVSINSVSNEDDSVYVEWAKNGFQPSPEKATSSNPFAPDPLNPIPPLAACYLPLDAIHQEALKTDDRLQQIAFYEVESAEDTDEKDEPIQIPEFKQSQVERVKKGEINITDICIACCCDHNPAADVVNGAKIHHPLFEGLLCKQCQETLKCTIHFAPFVAKSENWQSVKIHYVTGKVFCFVCIDLFVGPQEHEKIVSAQSWECYICNENSLSEGCLLKPKRNWRENVKAYFDPIGILLRSDTSSAGKSPIRILSLCDGIGGFKLVTDKLKLDVAAYYACESDRDAISVSKHHFENSIQYIDKIESLTPEKIASICPIDLVICGCAGNELSSSSGRKGFFDAKGNSFHFLYFNHVLGLIRLFNKGKHVFFLYENMASMPSIYRDVISHLTMCKPVTLNSRALTLDVGNRYMWSNIPGINRPFSPDLQSNMEKMLHTLHESDGKAKVESQSAVGIKELEQLLGFDENYTDVNILSKGKRMSLLRKSWSIPITSHILWALCDFFKTRAL